MDVDLDFFAAVQSFICLEGDQGAVADSIAFDYGFCRIYFSKRAFDVINHLVCFLV